MKDVTRKAAFIIAVTIAGSLSCGDSTGPSNSGPGRIAFMSRDDEGVWDIHAIRADRSGLRNLTRSAVEDVFPTFNRARTRIAFRSAKQPGGVFVMNADGSRMRHVYNQLHSDILHIAWSPDDRHLAIEGSWGDEGHQIRRLELATGIARTLIADAFSPDWSPDGLSIAFHAFVNGFVDTDVFVMNASNGGDVRNLTLGRGGFDPSWSPDGARIAFASGSGDLKIWVMNADGTNPVQLSTGFGNDRLPVWSRDGAQIAFQRSIASEITTVWTMNVDGTNQRNLTPSMPISANPTW